MSWDEHTPVPDAFLDADIHGLFSPDITVMLTMFRKTLGGRREGDHLSLSEIADASGLTHQTTRGAVRRLIEKGLIVDGSGKAIYRLSARYTVHD